LFRSAAYSALSGDSTDFAAFPDAVPAQQEEEFADFSSAFGRSNSSSNGVIAPASVVAPVAATPDLFGDFGGASSPPGGAATAANGDLDLFGALAAPPPTSLHFPSAAPSLLGYPVSTAAAASSLDLLGGLDLGSVPPVYSGPTGVGSLSPGSSLPALQPATLLPTGGWDTPLLRTEIKVMLI
jgi:hypothetical protein